MGAPLDGRRGGHRDGLAHARSRETAQIRVQLCAKGLRAQAELAALARARRDADAVRGWLDRARELIGIARGAAADAAPITPNAAGWMALAEAEYERARGVARPERVVGRGGDLGAARAPAARGLLPLAPGRGARRRRRAPRRGERAAPRGICRRRSDWSCAPAPRARAARPTRAARSRAANRGVARRDSEPRGDPRTDSAGGRGSDARRPRLHQPRIASPRRKPSSTTSTPDRRSRRVWSRRRGLRGVYAFVVLSLRPPRPAERNRLSHAASRDLTRLATTAAQSP